MRFPRTTSPGSPIRLALVGLGSIATAHLEALALTPEFLVVGGCDERADRRTLLPAGAIFGTGLEDMLVRADPDLVLVSTPTSGHYRLAAGLLERGYDVLLEKPACATPEEYADLLRTASKAGAFVHVCFHAAMAPEVEGYLEVSSALDLGEISRVTSTFRDSYLGTDVLLERSRSLEGAWLDSGINALSIIARVAATSEFTMLDAHVEFESDTNINISADATFEAVQPSGHPISVNITTRWLEGPGKKQTRIWHEDTQTSVMMDHITQKVVLEELDSTRIIFESHTAHSRLASHYLNVFSDAARAWRSGNPNTQLSTSIHQALYSAYFTQ